MSDSTAVDTSVEDSETRRTSKSCWDNESADTHTDLGFQWTPSIRLRALAPSPSPSPASPGNDKNEHLESLEDHEVQDVTKSPDHRPSIIDHPSIASINHTPDTNANEHSNLLYFNDNKRTVDYVLVYGQGLSHNPTKASQNLYLGHTVAEKDRIRQFFQENLVREGLQLEEDIVVHACDNRAVTVFVKVHCTWRALCRQAEILKIKMPLRLRDTYKDFHFMQNGEKSIIFWNVFKVLEVIYRKILYNGRPCLDEEIKIDTFEDTRESENNPFIKWPFVCQKIDKYAIIDQENFFSSTQRMEIVWEILQNARNSPNDEKKRGIEKLLEMGVYESAFPLHDGPATVKTKIQSQWCERQSLRRVWASWKCVFKKQPLDLIRKYYGEKISFYFAFLGFYTKSLTIPALAGMITFFYGLVYTGDDKLVEDVCDEHKEPGNYTMCPICSIPNCQLTKLSDACTNTIWDYRMDNEATLFMAVVTAIWSTIFIKAWKRRESELAYHWDTYEVQQSDGVVRPDYEERAMAIRRNPITREQEPYVPWATRSWCLVWSSCITLLMLCAVGTALACLGLARVALYGYFHELGIRQSVELARWFVHGMIFLVVCLFDAIYNYLGRKATSMECPRTDAQWLSSFLWKLFIFEILNDFVPIAYAAWFKGLVIRTPLDLTWKSELCDSGGCMGEVTELIAVLLLARLVFGNGMEVGLPFLKHVFARSANRRKTLTIRERTNGNSTYNLKQKYQWRNDNLLPELELDAVANEYMEMIVQFAFVTLFVPAFPVAPFVCLLNNILEIRVDAIKFIVSHRRPHPIRVPGIQLWNDFLDIIVKLSILCNGALISFTSEMIPRLYYKYVVNGGRDYDGFVQYSLSQLPMEAWCRRNDTEACESFKINNVTSCYYLDQRYSDEKDNFGRTQIWWKITCVRLMVFCAFLVFAYSFQWLYDFMVPDMPREVKHKIQRKRYVVTKAMEADVITERWLRGSSSHQIRDTDTAGSKYSNVSALASKRKSEDSNGILNRRMTTEMQNGGKMCCSNKTEIGNTNSDHHDHHRTGSIRTQITILH